MLRVGNQLKAVIFDWAGVTVDYGSRAPTEVFIEIFRRRGIDITSAAAGIVRDCDCLKYSSNVGLPCLTNVVWNSSGCDCDWYLIDYIERHRDQPFIAYYAAPLVHIPTVTTPLSSNKDAPKREQYR